MRKESQKISFEGHITLFNPLVACESIRICPQAGMDLEYCLNGGRSGKKICLGRDVLSAVSRLKEYEELASLSQSV